MSWDRLRSFCAVAGAGSIVKAAGGDPVRQSLISRQIRELEQAFETELVRRQGRGLVLTDEGRRLAAVARQQMQALQDFDDECRGRKVAFSLVASNTLLDAVVLPRLGAVRRALPGVAWRFEHRTTREAAVAVAEGGADFALMRRDVVPAGVESRFIGKTAWVMVLPPGMSAEAGGIARMLASVPLALPVGGEMRERLEAFAVARHIRLRVDVEVDAFRHALQIASAGVCAAIVPSVFVAGGAGDLRVVALPRALGTPTAYALCWRARLTDTRRMGAKAVETLGEVLSRDAQDLAGSAG